MRTWWEILQFELRQQLKSPFVLAVLPVFFLIHFLSITGTGIHLWAHPLANINSAYAIAVTETTLSLFTMLPVIVFVANAVLRDHDTATAALFFTKPISKHQFLWGRFSGACLLAILLGITGVVGTLVGTLMPWLDQSLVAPFSWQPFVFCFLAIVLPTLVIQCALFFSVATLTRSLAATVAIALVFMVGGIILATYVLDRGAGHDGVSALVLVDHSAALVVNAASRNLTVADLNTLLPQALLLENRLVWLAGAFAVLMFTVWRFRFEAAGTTANFFSRIQRLHKQKRGVTDRFDKLNANGTGNERPDPYSSVPFALRPPWKAQVVEMQEHFLPSLSKGSSASRSESRNPSTGSLTTAPALPALPPSMAGAGRTDRERAFSPIATLLSQLRMDVMYVLRSPLFLIIVILGIADTVSQYSALTSPIMNTAMYPTTSSMLGFFRMGLIQFVLIIAIYYSGALTHRERESGVADIVGASPFPDWILPLSKIISLCTVVTVLLLIMMATTIVIQALNGYTNFEFGLYLRSVFLYSGFYYWMLCVLAVLIQVIVSNKWLGMLLLLVAYIALLTLSAFGFEHVLYRFYIPYMVYSDMNGFGHASRQAHALIAYWACFCALLILLGHLLYPRGIHASFKERVRGARARFSSPTILVAAFSGLGFVATGGWIYYNTNILNSYQTTDARLQMEAIYEKKYGRYEGRPAPSFSDIDMAVDIFPAERRLESRGTAVLRNNKAAPIEEFVVSVNPKLRVNELTIDTAVIKIADTPQGFYLFALATPLQPGSTVSMRWNMSRINRGFANADHDREVIENGTFITGAAAGLPVPGFDDFRKIEVNAVRAKYGLPPAARAPALGDPKFLDSIGYGVDSASDVRVVMSTSADQIALAPGELKREWRKDGRRYFEYVMERPIIPGLSFTSARYEVATDTWTGASRAVKLEVYYDPKHGLNVPKMLATTKRSLDYYTREFSPYQFSSFRIVEYPRYRSAARAFPGMTPYSESAGFVTDLTELHDIDYATVHELAHMWWGGQAMGARMQGRELLNETLAQYSTLMVFKHAGAERTDPTLLNRITKYFQRGYLRGRGVDTQAELPLLYMEEQGHISYNKGPLALYALQELIGEAAVNQALRNYLAKFAFKPAPFPTSRDLVNELRAVAGPEHQDLITDLFEKIVLYDIQLVAASATKASGGYDVSITVSARQLEANGQGEETEVLLSAWFDVAVFGQSQTPIESRTPLYLKKHLLHSGSNTLTIQVADKPAYVGVDPFEKMADKRPENNGLAIEK